MNANRCDADGDGRDNEWCDYSRSAPVTHVGYTCNCGKSAGQSEGTVTDESEIKPSQYISSVTIDYNK